MANKGGFAGRGIKTHEDKDESNRRAEQAEVEPKTEPASFLHRRYAEQGERLKRLTVLITAEVKKQTEPLLSAHIISCEAMR